MVHKTMQTIDNQVVSIIIPSLRKKQLTKASVVATCPMPFEFIVSRKRGVAYARNWGAKQAKNNLLLFLDDDIDLKTEIWKSILGIQKGEFLMYLPKGTGFPCSRVVCIFSEDFWSIGGFDNIFTIGNEDHDFYIRALDAKLIFKSLPSDVVIHYEHHSRTKNIHTAIQAIRQNMIFVRRASHRHFPLILKTEFIDRLRRFQLITVMLELYWLFRLEVCK